MISVCVATYNGEKYIKDQLLSILNQLGPEDEVIVSDDFSTDSTLDIVRGIGDSRIRVISNFIRPHHINSNFESALRSAKGDVIFLADQDDVWLEGKVRWCMEGLKTSMCVVHDAVVTDGNLNVINESFFSEVNAAQGLFHNWLRNGYLGCAMAFHRRLLDVALPIPGNLLVWHDIWLGTLAQINGGVRFLPFKGMMFRRHQSATSVTFKTRLSVMNMLRYRLQLLMLIVKRLSTSGLCKQ